MATHLARSGLFTVKLTLDSDVPQDIIAKILDALRSIYPQPDLKLPVEPIDLGTNGGKLWIIQAAAPNSTLSGILRHYPKERLITLSLDEVNQVSGVENGDTTGPAPIHVLDNLTLDRLKNLLDISLEREVERVPIIKRAQSIPNYYTSSDDRILEYDYDSIVFHKKTDFQDVKILHSRTLGNSLILDDLQNLAEGDLAYTRGLMHHGHVDYAGKEILILGGGDGGLLHELLKENPKHVTMVDIDGVVVAESAKYMRGACGSTLDQLKGPNYEVIIGDCIKWMEQLLASGQSEKFDIIFNDLTDIPISGEDNRDMRTGWADDDNAEEQAKLWTFVSSILELAMKCLKNGGKYLNHAIGIGCTNALANYEQVLRNMPYELEFIQHTSWVPSFMENWVFYDVSKIGPK